MSFRVSSQDEFHGLHLESPESQIDNQLIAISLNLEIIHLFLEDID